ncbi:MAG TPA: dUTP diphosphatase [Candidatus Diapherotrites archaeon]|jgi:dUTP pyrophosphatase|nr:dUTP diphosphatase [Candidatus Diapherotrites archaeon]
MIKVKRLTTTAKLPTKAHDSDAGFDIFADEDKVIQPMSRESIHTGIAIELPEIPESNKDIYLRIAPRSGLSVKSGIDIFAGVVDRGYTGEIVVCMFNSSKEEFKINKGDKIAQLIPTLILKDSLIEVFELEESKRGDKGFGSSGK